MKRFWILLLTELKVWRHDPLSAMGGFIPPVMMLIAFGLLFGGRLTFKIAVINHDAGPYGAILRQTAGEVQSPFGQPYYDVLEVTPDEAWQRYGSHGIDGVWVIPLDFSERLRGGAGPGLEMHFANYNDDRAKNHRLYSAEILWEFYERVGPELALPGPPLTLTEEYPLPVMIEWFPVMAVGLVLLSFMLGGMINVFMLTHKEQVNGVTLEFSLAPRSLAWVLLTKVLVALVMGIATGTVLLLIVYAWLGVWPGRYLGAVWLLAALVILFWLPWPMLFGLRARQFAGAIATILAGMTVYFVGGGMSLVRSRRADVPWYSWLVPNTHAVDPLRDLILFQTWPADWLATLMILGLFALGSLVVGLGLTARKLRRLG